MSVLDNPEFEKAGRVHDWRNYVPEEFQDAWPHLTEREKKIIVIMAQSQADREEWD
jgi:hypothetical protein